MSVESHSDKLRIDKWLWAARFFKTRSMAAQAVSGGKVHLNGDRIKPSRVVKIGDRVRIRKGDQEFTINIMALSGTRRPANEAQLLYSETAESKASREKHQLAKRLLYAASPAPQNRPNKKQRRNIIRFRREER